MKIAIATDKGKVSSHFGHCEGFIVYEVDKDKVTNRESVPNPGHKPGFLPVFLKEKGINVIISGGMGVKAQQLFSDNDIQVIVGATGDCDQVIKEYINGNLESTGEVCEEHAHEGHCED